MSCQIERDFILFKQMTNDKRYYWMEVPLIDATFPQLAKKKNLKRCYISSPTFFINSRYACVTGFELR